MLQNMAAQRIVEIQGMLATKMTAPERKGLISEQSTLWDRFFAERPYEAILRSK